MNSPAPIRILSVDDHPMWREGIADLLAGESDMVLIAEATTVVKLSNSFALIGPM